MAEDLNGQRPTSNFKSRSKDEHVQSRLALDVQASAFDGRIFLQLILILLAGLFIYGLWLGDSPLDRTEPFRALVAHQMVKGGSWLVPRLYGEVYLRKPPLIYWIEASTEKLMGRGDEFVWRLPSAVGSALLAAFIGWWSGRWFGRRAILPAGFACLALVALWDQNRGADIDALNTAFAVLTTCCVLELLFGKQQFIVGWSVGLGLSLGATLLLKGPGGLPQVIAAMIGPSILIRDWKPLRRRAYPILAGFLIGFAFFAAYVIVGKIEMRRANIAPDHSGVYEIVEKTLLRGWADRLRSFGIPLALLAFAMPVTLVLPFAIAAVRARSCDVADRRRVLAIVGTLLVTLLIWVLGGNDNPRYEYVMLPLLAPLVGFVWQTYYGKSRSLALVLLGITILFCGGFMLIFSRLPRMDAYRTVLISGLVWSCLITCFFVVAFFARPGLAAKITGPVLALLLLLFALPMAARKNAERQRKSSRNAASQLRSVIGNASRVSAAGVVRDLPELFYYSGVDVDAYGEVGLPQLTARRGHWVVISEAEKYPAYSTIMKAIPNAFPRGITKLKMPDARDQIYVGWYDPPEGADTRVDWKVQKSTEAED